MPDSTCSVESCDRPVFVKSRGWCKIHYTRWWKHGDPLAPPALNRHHDGECSVEGCERPYKGKGYCNTHLRRFRKHGDPLAHVPIEPRGVVTVCLVAGCREVPKGLGLCNTHYTAQYRNEHAEEIREYNRRRYAADPEPKKKSRAKWIQANRERHRRIQRAATTRYRARKINALTVPFTEKDLKLRLSMFGFRCYLRLLCDGAPYEHVDHVIPLARGGPHTLSNLRPACARCNSAKNNRTLDELLTT